MKASVNDETPVEVRRVSLLLELTVVELNDLERDFRRSAGSVPAYTSLNDLGAAIMRARKEARV